MTYSEYHEASIRHLNTCKYLIRKIKNENRLQFHEKYQYFYNIYYLSGYAIEAIVNYGIYDYIRFDPNEDVKNLNNSIKSRQFDVTFSRNPRNYRFIIMHHNFQNNLLFFHYHNLNNISTIPFLAYQPSNQTMTDMFMNWAPEARYTHKITINNRYTEKYIELNQIPENDYAAFVELAEKIYYGIRTEIVKR